MKRLFIIFSIFYLFLSVEISVVASNGSFSYESFERVLENFVDEKGFVDYQELKLKISGLEAFLLELETLKNQEYKSWSEEEKIAFWINAYNALVLKVVLDNHPIQSSFFKSLKYPKNSIRQISGVFGKIKFPVMGKRMTLADIEHRILRKEFQEPRIHMALVCAALSCPLLRREPYIGDLLNEQLEDQVRTFLSDPQNFSISREKRQIYLSSIFKWFGEDFIPVNESETGFRSRNRKESAILYFISLRIPEEDRGFLKKASYRIKYMHYDWSLNEKRLP